MTYSKRSVKTLNLLRVRVSEDTRLLTSLVEAWFRWSALLVSLIAVRTSRSVVVFITIERFAFSFVAVCLLSIARVWLEGQLAA